MQAVVISKHGNLEVKNIPDPDFAENEVIVKISRAGIFGTDLHILNGEYNNIFHCHLSH